MSTLTTKPRLTSDAVMQQVYDKTKGIVDHCYLDRDWVWYCGPSLQGEANKPTRESLKAIGFRFAPGGHVMQDGKTRGSWGHSCNRPIHGKRRGSAPTGRKSSTEDAIDSLAALGL